MTKSQIFLYFCLSFIVGVFFSSFLELPSGAIGVFFILNAVLIFAFWKQKKAVVAGFCLFFAIFGFWRHQSFLFSVSHPADDKIWFFNDEKEKIIVIGTIKSEPAAKTNTNQFIINSEQIIIDGKRRKASGKVLITTRRYPEYKYGDRLKILSELKTPQQLEEFNYKNYLAKDGVYSVMNFPKIEVIAENQGDRAYSKILFFKNKLRESLYQNLSPPQSSILGAIILGDQNTISKEWKQKLGIAGIIHITSVSGAHIVIISGILMWTALSLGFWRSQAFYISLIFLFFYIVLVGAPASAVRAGIMGGMFIFAQKIGRLSSGPRALVFAAAFMLLDNPLLLRYDIGFQLSFLATLGLMLLMPFFQKWLFKISDLEFFSLRSLVAMTMSAQIFTLPVLIYNFGYVSLIAPIVNVLIVPLMPFIMIFGFIFSLAGAVLPFLGLILSWPSWILLTYMIKVVEWSSNIPWASFTMNISVIYLIIFYFLLGIFIFREREKAKLFAA